MALKCQGESCIVRSPICEDTCPTGGLMILQTLLRAVQAMIIGTMAGLMFLAATVLASLETVFRKKVRPKPI